MDIAKGRVDSGVSQDFSKRDDVSALDDVIAREGVAEVVHSDLSDARFLGSLLYLRPEVGRSHPAIPLVEDQFAIRVFPAGLKGFQQPRIDRDVPHLPALRRLCAASFDPYDPPLESTSFHIRPTISLTSFPYRLRSRRSGRNMTSNYAGTALLRLPSKSRTLSPVRGAG